MKYACLVYVEEAVMRSLSRDEALKLNDATLEFDARLMAEGRVSLAQPLQAPDTAMTIRVRNGKLSSTDGPFAETKEHLGGFFLIEARDMADAIELARTSPMASLGSIEIRPSYDRGRS